MRSSVSLISDPEKMKDDDSRPSEQDNEVDGEMEAPEISGEHHYETHYKIKTPTEKYVRLREAEKGMVLARDVLNDRGQLLFAEGTTLEKSIIQRLRNFGKRKVYVQDEETRWVDENEYEQRPDSVEYLAKKEVPAEPSESDSDEGPSTFSEVRDFIDNAESPRRLRQFIEPLEDASSRGKLDGDKFDLSSIREQADSLKDVLQYLLAQLSKIDDHKVHQQVLGQLFNLNRDRKAIPEDESIPDDISFNLDRVQQQKRDVKGELNDLIYETPELLESLETERIPDTLSDKNEESLAEKAIPEREIGMFRELFEELVGNHERDFPEEDVSAPETIKPDSLDLQYADEFLERSELKADKNVEQQDNFSMKDVNSLEDVIPGRSDGKGEKESDPLLEVLNLMEAMQGDGSVSSLLNEHEPIQDRLDYEGEGFDRSDELSDFLRSVGNSIQTGADPEKESRAGKDPIDDLPSNRETLFRIFRELLTEFLKKLDESDRSKILDNLEDVTDGSVLNSVERNDSNLSYEKNVPAEGTEPKRDEMLRDAVAEHDLDLIRKLNGLPDTVIDKVEELYVKPEETNKWQEELVDKLREILKQLVYGLRVPRDEIDVFLRRFKNINKKEKRSFTYFLQPPSPDKYHFVHAFNTVIMGLMIGMDMELPDEALKSLLLAGTLADIGLTVIPESFYLNEEELSGRSEIEIRKHPIYSRKIAGHILGPDHTVARLVEQHHERLDGSGYPDAQEKESLSLLATILSCSDVYTAMIEDRVYRKRKMPDQAIGYLEGEKGKFNPDVMECIRRVFGYYPSGTLVKLTNRKLAYVKEQNDGDPSNPKIYLLTNEKRERLDKPEKVNLSERDDLSAEVILRAKV